MIGKTISHYKIIEKLGEGGMGEVYLADDLKLERQVAIKFLPEHLTKDKENVERFEREAKAAAALNHPNIVTIYDVIEADDPATAGRQLCIVMEYVEGDSLRNKIDKGFSCSDEVLDITKQICEGLSEAHKAEIVHRDIKPENILIDNRGRVKILDFGLAKLKGFSKLTKETSTLGTIHYMSPEQIQGRDIEAGCDIWSLGVLIYEMITGQVPFKGDYDQAIFYSIMNEEPEDTLKYCNEEINATFSPIIRKALKKDKNDRYQRVEEILREISSGESKGIDTSKTRLIKFGSTKKRILLYSIIAVIVISVIFIFSYPFSEEKDVIDSIAVLPLDNLSGNPDEEFFAVGMTEAIISELSKMNALRIISRTSVMPYKNTMKLLPEIARELDVNSIIEGSVMRSGDRVRIAAQLIAFSPERHLWADEFERKYSDVLTISSEVAQSIAKEIKISLTHDEQKRIADAPQVNPEAHQLYLKAMYLIDKSTTLATVEKSIEFLNKSLETDPNYALAYAALAELYIFKARVGYAPRKEILPIVYPLITKALSIDSTSWAAYDALANAKAYEFQWIKAEELLRKSIALNPSQPKPHGNLGYLLSYFGRHDEAIREAKIARSLDPLSISQNVKVGRFYYYARQYDNAIAEFDKILDLNPDAIYPQLTKAMALTQKGLYDQAIELFLKRKVKSPGTNWALGYTYGVAGYKDKAREVLNFLIEKSKKTYIWPAIIAYVYIGLGDKDNAIHWLEKTYNEQEAWLEYLKVDPWFDSLREDERFQDLIKRMNYPE